MRENLIKYLARNDKQPKWNFHLMQKHGHSSKTNMKWERKNTKENGK